MADLEVRRFVDLAASILALHPSYGPVRVVAIDGPGGAGKSTFAARLDLALGGVAVVPVVHADDFASWDNQFQWAARLRELVLDPLGSGLPGRYQRYDWVAREFAEWHEVPLAPAVIVEGVGAAQAHFADALAMTVWIETPPDVRLARGLARDGEHMRGFWEQWTAAERAHFAADRTRSRADLVVAGDPAAPHEAETEYVVLG